MWRDGEEEWLPREVPSSLLTSGMLSKHLTEVDRSLYILRHCDQYIGIYVLYLGIYLLFPQDNTIRQK